jgi:hypothetical protein
MVWKFDSAAAQEKHAKRFSRIEPTQEPTSFLNAEAPPPLPDEPVVPPGSRVEPFLPAETGFVATRTRLVASNFVLESEVSEEAPEAQPAARLEEVVEECTAIPLSWEIAPFTGDPDELPDLMPAPPAPMEHLGHQFNNINTFGHALRLPAEDERQAQWAEQRRDRGFDDTELWGLDDSFSRFILPRLKALRQQKLEPPHKTMELTRWHSLLDKMIHAFELLLPEAGGTWSRGTLTDRERAQVQEGLDHFRTYFFALSC